jgi:hypothetical protein
VDLTGTLGSSWADAVAGAVTGTEPELLMCVRRSDLESE